MAKKKSIELGKPLVVIGDPINGAASKIHGQTYGYGDFCIDLTGCPLNTEGISIKSDATKAMKKFANNSVVIFSSCVLEYIPDIDSCIKEMKRIAGENIYIVHVNAYTLAAYLYGRVIPAHGDISTSKNIIYNAPPNGDFVYRIIGK